MSFEKFNKTIYFFNTFNEPIDEWIVKKMSKILYVEFVEYHDFYDPSVIRKKIYAWQKSVESKFNKSVDLLPSHIKSIIFNNQFNQTVCNLPIKLKQLVFGNNFNQLVDNLPSKLVKLIFGNHFNQEINNLPPIKILLLGKDFNQTLDYLPGSITYLELKSNLLLKNDNLPSSIKFLIIKKYIFDELKIYSKLDNIPKNTKIIHPLNCNNYLTNKKIRL